MAPRNVILLLVLVVFVGPFLVPTETCGCASKVDSTQVKINGLDSTIETFRTHCGRYPTTAEGTAALLAQPTDPTLTARWAGPYLRRSPKDAWGNDLIYRAPGVHHPQGYDLSSAGPNGIPGDADDITNW